ncbi:HupE/UreJ family protein [Povalibacter sp.]|uniref:HupE/UreJ family protein n=1 Tax=Povalibacter sp. TaxID=1962978 RepID=UPI002F407DB2
MTTTSAPRFTIGLLLSAMSSLALAHPDGHGAHDLAAGFLHPFSGLDHLLAMIAVGLWAVRLGRRAVWTLPIVFPLAMVAGAGLALSGTPLPAIEPMIALSVIVLGVLVAVGVRLPVVASALLVAMFAIFHGYAHAAEAPSSQIGIYAVGFVTATVILHALGVLAGMAAMRQANAPLQIQLNRFAGFAIAVSGAVVFLTT